MHVPYSCIYVDRGLDTPNQPEKCSARCRACRKSTPMQPTRHSNRLNAHRLSASKSVLWAALEPVKPAVHAASTTVVTSNDPVNAAHQSPQKCSKDGNAHRKHPVPLLLALITVDGEGWPAVHPQLARYRVAAPLCFTEDEDAPSIHLLF